MPNYPETNRELRDNDLSHTDNISLAESNRRRLTRRQSIKIRHGEILSDIEKTKFGWLHVKKLMTYSIGFFTNAYQLLIINIIILMMGCVYYKDNDNTVPIYIDTLIKASSHIGILIGQLLFGVASDKLGRKRIYGTELLIIVVSGAASALSGSTVSGMSVFAQLFIWRVFLGVGIGGDYPLSATITSEGAKTKHRGAMMAAIFAMQGVGIVAAALMSIIILAIFKNAVYQDQNNLDFVWRLCLGLGCIPACIGIYFRLTISETPRYAMKTEMDTEEADMHKKEASFIEFYRHFKKWKNFKVLLATSITWFTLDVGFYGINLNTGLIIEAIGFSGDIVKDPWNSLFKNSIGNLIVSFLGILPGYWVSVFLVDRIGRKPIQLVGFGILTILMLILGFGFNQIRQASVALFIVIFTIMQFFFTFGPNTTTFIIPGEVFPTKYRSTAHGISAACGKLGAIISQVGFFQMRDIGGRNQSIPLILIIFSFIMFIGFMFTFLLPETKGKSLEELSDEFTSNNNSNSIHSNDSNQNTQF
ncbi:unnamed protein product [Brachionus calyciflorus]|uniref:Major facilitator superfamily (MFS) profile domain-containing protein n=1 Tax=Brachionus calyciflorus TaxID=104777 RepID=A0A813XR61_9BILA|nr:unnamed protein product [Brachionus calyciflorus]